MGSDWVYCAYCGNELPRNSGLMNEFKKIFSGLTIRIKSGDNQRILKMPENLRINVRKNQRILKMPENPEEPKTKVNRLHDEIRINLELPGIKKLDNVLLTRFEESIEVRAVTKNKGYFKVLQVPNNFIVSSKKLSKEMLELRLKERLRR